MFHVWKAEPIEFEGIEHGYSFASDYYKCREIRGIRHYRITMKGLWKIKEGRLCKQTHNFMVYLAGSGKRLVNEEKYENGDIR